MSNTNTLFRFAYGPALLSGAGAAGRVGELVGTGRVLVVTDRTVRKLGLIDAAVDNLLRFGCELTIFDNVEADPKRATLLDAVAAGRHAACDRVVGIGGGSPMDVAKLAAYLLGSGDDLDDVWGVDKASRMRLPLTLVPTTAGTGSEATPVSIITVGAEEKRGVSSRTLVPDHAVLDPALTTGLPAAVTAATGIDAMVHAIESYTSARLKNPMSDLLAREALRLLATNLRLVLSRPGDLAAREAMLLGAHLAGVAFANAPVGGVHALAYPVGSRFHVAHGVSNILVLPHVMRHNMIAAAPLYAELAPLVDPALSDRPMEAQAEGLIAALSDLSNAGGLPGRLGDVGIRASDIAGLAADAMLQQRLLQNNPRLIEIDDARRIYEAAI